jgi:hypothetical protein
MIYELRTYWAAEDKLDALNTRFRTLTLELFARHQLKVIGFWIPEPRTAESGDLVYILAASDARALADGWDKFRADPDWQAGRAASEVDGKLVDKVTSVMLTPTDYSPLV